MKKQTPEKLLLTTQWVQLAIQLVILVEVSLKILFI